MKIKIGDVVKLKTGSYKMTIREINDNKIICDYFDSINELQTIELHIDDLEFI
jgi:uncharacterized protein YodC (DUF2158 family)